MGAMREEPEEQHETRHNHDAAADTEESAREACRQAYGGSEKVAARCHRRAVYGL
jgi:hypothetical protein